MITSITLAELSVGPLLADDEAERAARQARLQEAEAAFEPLPFDASAAGTFGRVAASLRRGDRKTTARAFDALIAATAMANDLLLYTCNPGDFDGIAGLTVVAIPHLTSPFDPPASLQSLLSSWNAANGRQPPMGPAAGLSSATPPVVRPLAFCRERECSDNPARSTARRSRHHAEAKSTLPQMPGRRGRADGVEGAPIRALGNPIRVRLFWSDVMRLVEGRR